jgi:hypothetical protein
MELTYLGTNTLLLRKSGSAILIDPHFTRPGLRQLVDKIRPNRDAIKEELTRVGIDALDAVLLTHTHYDHALDAVTVLDLAGGILFGSSSAMNLAMGEGLAEQRRMAVTPGKTVLVGAFKVIFYPSQHIAFPAPISWLMPRAGKINKPVGPPIGFWNYQCGQVYAIQVEQTLIFGSAGFIPGTFRHLQIHSSVLGVGGLDTKSTSYLQRFYQESVLLPGANQVYVSHWDNFFTPLNQAPQSHILARRSIDRIKALGERHGQTVQRLNIAETVMI